MRSTFHRDLSLEGFPTLEEIGEVIRTARVQRQLSQKTMAMEAGCAPAYVSQFETGQRQLSIRIALQLERILGLPKGSLAKMVFSFQLYKDISARVRKAKQEGYEVGLSLKLAQTDHGAQGRLRIE